MQAFVVAVYFILLCYTELFALENGENAWLANARFIASVRLRQLEQERLGSGFLCTATLINNWHVVTAATCVTFHLTSQLQVVMGVVDVSRRNRLAVTRNVQRMFFHPTFERNSETSEFYGNVAVLRLASSVRDSTSDWWWMESGLQNGFRNLHIQPVRMSSKFSTSKERCAFFAWGRRSPDADALYPNLLMANVHFAHDDPQCRNSSTVFCAGDANRGAALCHNLGGSMICEQTFFGVALTDSCHGPGHFHAIAAYRDWILVASHASWPSLTGLVLIPLALICAVL